MSELVETVWLVGTGPMAVEYEKVLTSIGVDLVVIGRSANSVDKFHESTGRQAFVGGIDKFLETKPVIPSAAIICVGVDQLASIGFTLINYGVKSLLLEKPGGVNSAEVKELADTSISGNCSTYVAYNRRYYQSVLKAKELILEDGGAVTCSMELTEWSHIIKDHKKPSSVLESWFIGNTSHVVDLGFFLIGKPKEISCFTSGSLNWHPKSSALSGAGRSEKGALFSYHANWMSAGRWSLDVTTNKRRYIFRPLEELRIQEIGSLKETEVVLEDGAEKDFKPGLFKQVVSFLGNDDTYLCSISEQLELISLYEKMASY